MVYKVLFIIVYLEVTLFAHYQDILINNIVIAEGSYECAKRYEIIKKILSNYQRPITILDLGASEGYFSFKIAQDYSATCVMVEGDYQSHGSTETSDRLEELCKENTEIQRSILLLKKYIIPQELKILSEYWDFDVVLALNFINHFGSQWKKAADAILNLGDNIIIEIPSAENKDNIVMQQLKDIEKYLTNNNGELLAEIYYRHKPHEKASTLYLFKKSSKQLKRVHWEYILPESQAYTFSITSTQDKKLLYNRATDKAIEWPQGINKIIFRMLNGVFPENYDPKCADPSDIELFIRTTTT